jgi:hypothetical protein
MFSSEEQKGLTEERLEPEASGLANGGGRADGPEFSAFYGSAPRHDYIESEINNNR